MKLFTRTLAALALAATLATAAPVAASPQYFATPLLLDARPPAVHPLHMSLSQGRPADFPYLNGVTVTAIYIATRPTCTGAIDAIIRTASDDNWETSGIARSTQGFTEAASCTATLTLG